MLIAQVSAGINLASYIGTIWVSQEGGFVVITVPMALSSGFHSVVQSLSLELIREKNDIGKLFGGLSVLQSLW